ATTVNIVNSASLQVSGVGSGSLDNRPAADTPVLDLFVAPVHLDLLGLQADTAPIHLTLIAHSGNGLVLGNVVTDLANLFNPPLQPLSIDLLNQKLAALLKELNDQIPGITPATSLPVNLGTDQFLNLTVPAINLNLLGLLVKT